jgi:hypothetical protein
MWPPVSASKGKLQVVFESKLFVAASIIETDTHHLHPRLLQFGMLSRRLQASACNRRCRLWDRNTETQFLAEMLRQFPCVAILVVARKVRGDLALPLKEAGRADKGSAAPPGAPRPT